VNRRRIALVTAGLAVALVALAVISAGTGQLDIPAPQVLGSILNRLGIDWLPSPEHVNGDNALWQIRFPRVLMAILCGTALAVAGLLMQAVFGNPLAESGVIGVSGGAALGASAAIVLGWSFLGEWTLALVAFVTGLAATLVVYAVSRANGRTEVVTLILTGIAVNAFTGAGIAYLTFLGDTAAREQIVFWQLGSLNGARWQQLAIVAPCVIGGLVAAFLVVRQLDLLALGERPAKHLGVNVERLRIVVIVVVALLVAAAVAFAGIISFVGLVVPHLMRMLIGPAHLPLLITSSLGGAVLLLGADLVARTAVANADLPIGMLTALVGGPFFFWLLRRTRKRAGGWA
jgi:iron complex transport system permease protein